MQKDEENPDFKLKIKELRHIDSCLAAEVERRQNEDVAGLSVSKFLW
jgi:hypothetical protein